MVGDKGQLDGIPFRVIKRLPSYRSALAEAIQAGHEKVSSTQLADSCGFTASQIRQDLSHFGSFGQQGYGYGTQELLAIINHILGVDATCHMALVGVGQLGRALLSYPGFADQGFHFIAAFDCDPGIVGQKVGEVIVSSMDDLDRCLYGMPVEVGVIAVPRDAAQDAADRLVTTGVKGIWNFASAKLTLPDGVALETVNLGHSLLTLAFRIKPRAISEQFTTGTAIK